MSDSNPRSSARGTPQTTRWQLARIALERHQGSPYSAFREALRVLLPYELRRSVVNFIRHRFGLLLLRNWLFARRPYRNHPRIGAPSSNQGDFYHALQLLPHLSQHSLKEILNYPISISTPRRPDVICFSIIDWSFRFQRPQQLMTQFAAHGHRVFYL